MSTHGDSSGNAFPERWLDRRGTTRMTTPQDALAYI